MQLNLGVETAVSRKALKNLVPTCSRSLSVVHSINYMLQLTLFAFMICLSIPASADHKECMRDHAEL
jgi:hypothetical protein